MTKTQIQSHRFMDILEAKTLLEAPPVVSSWLLKLIDDVDNQPLSTEERNAVGFLIDQSTDLMLELQNKMDEALCEIVPLHLAIEEVLKCLRAGYDMKIVHHDDGSPGIDFDEFV